jgi:hypothetical protein
MKGEDVRRFPSLLNPKISISERKQKQNTQTISNELKHMIEHLIRVDSTARFGAGHQSKFAPD